MCPLFLSYTLTVAGLVADFICPASQMLTGNKLTKPLTLKEENGEKLSLNVFSGVLS